MFNYFFKPLLVYLSSDRRFLQTLKRLFGFYPGNTSLYKLAFKHKSYGDGSNKDLHPTAIGSNNERLEYLGDAVLGAIIANYLFLRFPYKDEGFLTEMRSKIVNRQHLNNLAIKLGINSLILESGNEKARSVYGDAFEALVGAVYLDKGYKTTRDFIINRIIKYHIDMDELELTELNFKGKLLDWGNKEKKEVKFEFIEEPGRGNEKTHTVRVIIDKKEYSMSTALSKKRAEQRAAEETIKQLGI